MADFATVTELETYMGTTGLGARGTAILGYASALIRNATDQDLEATAGRQEEFAANEVRRILTLQQRPVTAVTSLTIDAVAFTDFEANYMAATIHRNDWGPWDTGPIVVTYDSGYAPDSDEMIAAKAVCLAVAARALQGPEVFGPEIAELRGAAPALRLTDDERAALGAYAQLVVA